MTTKPLSPPSLNLVGIRFVIHCLLDDFLCEGWREELNEGVYKRS